jgi:small subunit ribosomal protein S14
MNYSQSSHLISNTRIQLKRDIQRRILFDLFERERKQLKRERSNLKNPLSVRLNIQQALNNLPGKYRIKNRCILTGRARSIYRHFKLSRIMIKELSAYGLLPGIQKSSW